VLPHGAGKGDLILLAGATLDMAGFSETVNGLSSEAADAQIINSSINPSVLTVGANSATGSYSGTISGDITLIKSGTGQQTLTAPCSYTGNTVVDEGILSLDSGCTLASETVEVHRDAVLVIADGDVFGGTNSVTRLFAGVDASTQGDQARIEIAAGVDVTVLHFGINGVFKPAGTWGAAGSGAQFVDDEIFTGEGVLSVLETGPARGTVLLLR
jgi:autotransporter-associated beta strand protein